jgi:hypothetical protein
MAQVQLLVAQMLYHSVDSVLVIWILPLKWQVCMIWTENLKKCEKHILSVIDVFSSGFIGDICRVQPTPP